MNVINIYLQTCRYVMQAQANDTSTWEDLYRYLPYLRQALSCCVCTKIMLCPMGPIESKCQHHVCRDCRGGKMRLRPSCSWCKNWEEFVENSQLRLAIQCFSKLCDYLASSFIAQHLNNNDSETDSCNALLDIIKEGRTFNDDYSFMPARSLTIPCLLPSKISAPNGTTAGLSVSVKQEALDTTQEDSTVKVEKDHYSEENNVANTIDTDQKSIEVEDQGKVTSTSGLEPLDTTVTSSSSSGHPNSGIKKRRLSATVGVSGHQSPQRAIAEHNGVDDAGEGDLLASHVGHGDPHYAEASCSSSEPASSAPNSPIYEPCSSHGGSGRRTGATGSIDREYNQDSYSGIYSVSISNDHAPKLKIRRTDRAHHHQHHHHYNNSSDNNATDDWASSVDNSYHKQKSRSKKARQKKKLNGCRCGLATPTPGKLTCCGQRCPCYSAFKGCLPECRCRGCRNPRMVQMSEDHAQILSANVDQDSDDDSEVEVDI